MSERNPKPKAVMDCHELLQWIIPQLDQFPRVRRFTLGERIESDLLLVLELLVDAAYRRDKRESLVRANRKLEVVRHLWRLALELRAISVRRYEHGVRLMLSLGQQLGGWLKASRA